MPFCRRAAATTCDSRAVERGQLQLVPGSIVRGRRGHAIVDFRLAQLAVVRPSCRYSRAGSNATRYAGMLHRIALDRRVGGKRDVIQPIRRRATDRVSTILRLLAYGKLISAGCSCWARPARWSNRLFGRALDPRLRSPSK